MNLSWVTNVFPTVAVVALWAAAACAAPPEVGTSPPAGRPTLAPEAGIGTSSSQGGGARRFPASGQTTAVVAGDDGSLRAGAPLSYVDNGDGTITDRNTGLMWEKKVKLDSSRDPADLHDADNCYPWDGRCAATHAACGTDSDCGANGPCNAADCQTALPKGLTIFKWVAQLNAAKFAGHDDWRLPNAKELQSIVDYNVVNPSIAPAFHGARCGSCGTLGDPACACTQTGNYWSSTTYALPGTLDGAWAVFFGNGTVGFNIKHSNYFVRAVRGGM